MTTKLYIGNVPLSMTREDILHMFEPYGEIVECDIVKNYAFLHYSNPDSAREASKSLNGVKFDNANLKVEVSRSKLHTQPFSTGHPGHSSRGGGGGSTKVFIGNVSPSSDVNELRKLFETYGTVTSCDIVRDFAFVHFEHESEAELAVEMLNGAEFEGKTLSVEKSHNKARKGSDIGAGQSCFRCGRPGHMARECYFPATDGYEEPDPYSRPPVIRGAVDPYEDPYEDPYYRYAMYRSRYAARDRMVAIDPYHDYMDPYERPPTSRYSASRLAYRDPYERPPPYYYDRLSRREPIDPYEERDRYAMRAREVVSRRRAGPY